MARAKTTARPPSLLQLQRVLVLLALLLTVAHSFAPRAAFPHHHRPAQQRPAAPAAVPASVAFASRPPARCSDLLIRHAAAGDGASDDDQHIISRVQAWIKNMVIGLRLCPFAEGVVVADTVKYVVSQGRTPTEVVTDVMTEALRLVTTKEELVATTVIIAPQAFVDDFPSFYETELFLEEHLEDSPLGEDVMVACFHPQYLFGGEPEDDPIHFEKRSPYPVFNLLRAQRVFQYADEGKTERIAANNQETLSRTGIAEVRRRFALEAPEEELEEGDGS